VLYTKQNLCSLQGMILHTIYANTRLMAGSQKRLTCLQRNCLSQVHSSDSS